jgi:hypothetical protein
MFIIVALVEEDIMTMAAARQDRRFSRLATTAGATALAIGLLTTGSVLYSTFWNRGRVRWILRRTTKSVSAI